MDFTPEERESVERQYAETLSACKKIKDDASRQRVRAAFELANERHYPTRRKSGEPYITHPLSVARIVGSELGLGTTSVMSALLHDVVEDTDTTVDELERRFGPEVAYIVDGLSKISGALEMSKSMQVENFKKIFVTMSQDVRVILIKLADRLHNMRTLDSMPRGKQVKIASETLYLFAPIAHRLGLYTVKTELEDKSFRILQPDEYAQIAGKLEGSEQQRVNFINRFTLPIAARLTEAGFDFEISGRPKGIYSIHQKIVNKGVTFEEIYDLFAIRIIFDPASGGGGSEKDQCFRIYSLITGIYTPRPERLRDWVTQPKRNGYEALHSTLLGPGGRWVEVQIRTRRMDEIAELGYATHYRYKGYKTSEGSVEEWLDAIRTTVYGADLTDPDVLKSIKEMITASDVGVFSPKGDCFWFPKGATALDYAYSIHPKKIGHRAISAKVNHTIQPLNYRLRNGDQVEIITSAKQEPREEWRAWAKTGKAQRELRKFFNRKLAEQAEQGRALLEDMLLEMKLQITPRITEKVKTHYNIPVAADDAEAFARLAREQPSQETLKKILRQNPSQKKILFWTIKNKRHQDEGAGAPLNYHLAGCCNPIPGDPVQGYREADGSITLHRANCPEALNLSSTHGDRIVEVDWFAREQKAFLSSLRITGADRKCMLNEITEILSKEMEVNIRSINIYTHDGIFEGGIDLYVKSAKDAEKIIGKIRALEGVDNVWRPV